MPKNKDAKRIAWLKKIPTGRLHAFAGNSFTWITDNITYRKQGKLRFLSRARNPKEYALEIHDYELICAELRIRDGEPEGVNKKRIKNFIKIMAQLDKKREDIKGAETNN